MLDSEAFLSGPYSDLFSTTSACLHQSVNMAATPSISHLHTRPQNDDQQDEVAFHKERPEEWSPDHLGTMPTKYSHGSGTQIRSSTKTSHRMHGMRSKLGLHPQAPVNEEHDLAEHQDLVWSRVRMALREPFAEFMGVFILVLFGNGSVAQVQLSAGQVTAPGIFAILY